VYTSICFTRGTEIVSRLSDADPEFAKGGWTMASAGLPAPRGSPLVGIRGVKLKAFCPFSYRTKALCFMRYVLCIVESVLVHKFPKNLTCVVGCIVSRLSTV